MNSDNGALLELILSGTSLGGWQASNAYGRHPPIEREACVNIAEWTRVDRLPCLCRLLPSRHVTHS